MKNISDNELLEKCRLANIADSLNDAIIIITPDGRIIDWNKGAEKLYGYTKRNALSISFFNLIPESVRAQQKFLFDQVLVNKKLKKIETERITKTGKILNVRLSLTQIRDSNGDLIALASIERDITEYKLLLSSYQEVAKALLVAQETERAQIAEELHDDIGQLLVAIKIKFASQLKSLLPDSPHAMTLYAQLLDYISIIIEKIRGLSHSITPPRLEQVGLIPIIKSLIQDIRRDATFQIIFTHRQINAVNTNDVGIVIYRIIQESLHNAMRHSKATHVKIQLVKLKRHLSLLVQDNGVGFNHNQLKSKPKSLGLALMQQRAELIGAELTISSKPKIGTKIKLVIPL